LQGTNRKKIYESTSSSRSANEMPAPGGGHPVEKRTAAPAGPCFTGGNQHDKKGRHGQNDSGEKVPCTTTRYSKQKKVSQKKPKKDAQQKKRGPTDSEARSKLKCGAGW